MQNAPGKPGTLELEHLTPAGSEGGVLLGHPLPSGDDVTSKNLNPRPYLPRTLWLTCVVACGRLVRGSFQLGYLNLERI